MISLHAWCKSGPGATHHSTACAILALVETPQCTTPTLTAVCRRVDGMGAAQEAVRGDHGEVVAVLQQHGAKVINKEGELVDLSESTLSYNVRIFGDFDPEWEIDPAGLTFLKIIGAPLPGAVLCCAAPAHRCAVAGSTSLHPLILQI